MALALVPLGAGYVRPLTLEQLLAGLSGVEAPWPPSWSSADRLQVVQWDGPRFKALPDGVCVGLPFYRSGRLNLSSHGSVSLHLCGDEGQIVRAELGFLADSATPVAPIAFHSAIQRQFTSRSSIRLIRQCTWLHGFAGFAVYEVRPASQQPLFVSVMTDSGGSMPGTQATTYSITHHASLASICSS